MKGNIIYLKIDGVIILGGGLTNKGALSKESVKRAINGIKLFKAINAKYLILSGNGSWQHRLPLSRTEAGLMADLAVKKGVSKKTILKDTKSLDTIGNIYFTKTLIDEYKLGKSFLIVTSNYHLKRAQWLFTKIFGSKYSLIFKGINPRLTPKQFQFKMQRDSKILKYTKRLFSDYKIKNKKDLKVFLFNNHPFYVTGIKRAEVLKEEEKRYKVNFIDI